MRRTGFAGVLAVGGLIAAGGCSSPSNPWSFAEPPAVEPGGTHAQPRDTGRTVIAVTPFRNPDVPQLEWPDVGAAMADALRRTLLNEGYFEVRTAPEVEKLVSGSQFIPAQGTTKVEPVEIDFVVTGQVTDFHHTAGLPKTARRWSFLWRRSEAVVAIDWKAVDVRTRRVVAADHSYGTHDANRKKDIKELYSGLDLSAYLFWNTPLGKAGRKAIDRTSERLRKLLPARIGEPVVVKVHSDRKLSVEGGWSWGLAEGQEYYLMVRSNQESPPACVDDVDTGRPLKVKITSAKKDSSMAWLLGKAPPGFELRGAKLSRNPAVPQDDEPVKRAALRAGAKDAGGT